MIKNLFLPITLVCILVAPATLLLAANSQNFEQTLRQAKNGVSTQMLKVGEMYLTGVGTEKDQEKGLYWYGKASGIGYREGTYQLAEIYEKGAWLVQDTAKATELYRKAAKAGHEGANEALIRLTGQGVTPVVAKPQPRKSSKPKSPKVSSKAYQSQKTTLASIKNNRWKRLSRDALYLPSKQTYCNTEQAKLTCTSKKLSGEKGNSRYSYRIRSELGNFTPDGYFEVKINFLLSDVSVDQSIEFSDSDVTETYSNRQLAKALREKNEQLACELNKTSGKVSCTSNSGRKSSYVAK